MTEEKTEKKATEMTTRELARKLFPAGARAEVRREVAEKPKKADSKFKKPEPEKK